MKQVVLLTGITGFVGGATAAELLARTPAVELLVLVRASSQLEAQQRVLHSLARFIPQAELAAYLSRIEIVLADLTNRSTIASPCLDRATHVLHLAANTSLRSLRGVRHTNILGTLTLVQRLRRLTGLQRFVYVGTAHVCGIDPGPLVHEDDFPRWNVEHAVEYTRSKSECEMLLDNTAFDLPIVVARPSIVVGHTQLGCTPSASIFWYYRLADRLGLITAPTESLKDIVPVDYVARALVALLFKESLQHVRYHISAGVHAAVSWREIQAAFAQSDARPLGEPYETVSVEKILAQRDRIVHAVGSLHVDRVCAALEPFYRLSATGVQVFDNTRLLAEGSPQSPRFTDYLAACLPQSGERPLWSQIGDDE